MNPIELVVTAQRRGDAIHVTQSDGADVIVITRRTAPERLTLAAASELAGCSERKLRGAIRIGELPAAGTRRTLTVARSDLLAWIESKPACKRSASPLPAADDDEAEIDRRMKRSPHRGPIVSGSYVE